MSDKVTRWTTGEDPNAAFWEALAEESASVRAAVESGKQDPGVWAHEPYTRERLAQSYDRAARNEHRRPTENADYERGRAEAFRLAACWARLNGVYEF